MPYSVEADVARAAGGRERLIQLTDHEKLNEVDQALLLAKIAEADAWMNSHFEKRYLVPLDADSATVPEVVRRISARLTILLLREDVDALTPVDITRWEQINTWLAGVRDGNISPGLEPRPAESAHSAAATTGDRESKKFSLTREKFEGFV